MRERAMKKHKYLIVGGGMTADAAVKGIRERDSSGDITVISAESDPPYDRPPLSKKLWTGKAYDKIWRNTAEKGAEVVLDTRIVSGDLGQRTVTDDKGDAHGYEKLLIATGGTPRRLPFAAEDVIYYRTAGDYRTLRGIADRKAEVAVIGGGFIGSEIACALAINGCKVTLVFPGAAIGSNIYPPALSQFLNEYFAEKGVTVLAREKVVASKKEGAKHTLTTESGKSITADAVVVGIGIEPEVGLARSLNLPIDNGIVVDAQLRAKSPDVYAAGDVANFYSAALDTRRRVEHEDNANTMGAMAGRNMAGAGEKYEYLPYFYSDLFDLGYEAVGELGGALDVVEDWQEPFRKGVVYYLQAGRVRGVLLWNVWDKVPAARELIESNEESSAEALKGRIG
jgi:NADPH-dependent 2,4-dienoyl-CoA reductase/sulfur reductase-like enzyme